MIHHAETWFPDEGLPPEQMAAAVLHPRFGWRGPVPEGVALEVFLVPFVNDGRWIVQCPSCNSAQFAAREDPRFFCVDCGNRDHGGLWITVQWPPAKMVEALEAVLDARPDSKNKNWRPGEALADLIAENDAHDVPVPAEARAEQAGQ